MNLETFKARARRKLELRHRGNQTASKSLRTKAAETDPSNQATTAEQPQNTMTTSETTAAETSSNTDKFARALAQAQHKETQAQHKETQAQLTETTEDRSSANERPALGSNSIQSLTGSPARSPEHARASTQSSDSQLNDLRALLLGDAYDDQRAHVEATHQRTQTDINSLRGEMDARLTDLTKYVEQLEQSILNSAGLTEENRTEHPEGETSGLVANAEERFTKHEQRMDALDLRLNNTLATMREELNKNRESDRQYIKTELDEASARTDKRLDEVSARLEASISGIEAKLSNQLSTQSVGLMAESESSVANLRTQLGNLIDERVKSFNEEQSSGLVQLRDTLLSNTKEINSELKLQTEEQRKTLEQHRIALETQFNAAIETLTKSKVSHKELSQLLARLADLVAQ